MASQEAPGTRDEPLRTSACKAMRKVALDSLFPRLPREQTLQKIASAEVLFNVFSCIKSRYIYAKEKKFILGKTRSVRRILLFMPSNERQSIIHHA